MYKKEKINDKKSLKSGLSKISCFWITDKSSLEWFK